MLGIVGAVLFSNDFVLKEEAFCIIEGMVVVSNIFVSIVEGIVGDVFGNTVVFLVSISFDFCLGIFCPPPPRFVVELFKGERMSKSPVTRLTSGPV